MEADSELSIASKVNDNDGGSIFHRFDNIESMDAFDILGVDVEASDEMIRSAYLKLALLYHPDKMRNTTTVGSNGAGSIDSAYIFHKINDAWNALFQPKVKESLRVSRLVANKAKNFELNCEMLSISCFDRRPDGTYCKSCRCGGYYEASQEDLDEEINTFQCSDCSLYVSII
jgi:hypothetical protein